MVPVPATAPMFAGVASWAAVTIPALALTTLQFVAVTVPVAVLVPVPVRCEHTMLPVQMSLDVTQPLRSLAALETGTTLGAGVAVPMSVLASVFVEHESSVLLAPVGVTRTGPGAACSQIRRSLSRHSWAAPSAPPLHVCARAGPTARVTTKRPTKRADNRFCIMPPSNRVEFQGDRPRLPACRR